MAIADDVKKLFRYISSHNLITGTIIGSLTDAAQARRIFSSGKFPIFLKVDESKNLVEQKKFGTSQSRYYSPEEFQLEFQNEKYLLTNNIYENQREKYLMWFSETFSIDPKRILMPNTFYYVKLSCPKPQNADNSIFGLLVDKFSKHEIFSEILSNIPNALDKAKVNDIVFVQLGGDSSNKSSLGYNFENGIHALCSIEEVFQDSKELRAKFYPLKSAITKMDLYLYPQFNDNMGCATKGIPNQAGLYELSLLTGMSLLDYIKINELEGSSSTLIHNIDSKGFLEKGITSFYNSKPNLLSSASSKILKSMFIENTPSVALGLFEHSSFGISTFIDSLKTANLSVSTSLPYRFVSALQTKPFVILTGLSGSGKTKLAEAFSLWISESSEQYQMVSVGADWTNREPLLGFPNALEPGKYVKPDTGVLDLLLRASKNETRPYFLILDEMNMSHVERYFADFLSAMESTEGEISLHPDGEEWGDCDVPSTIVLPKNLFIIGTVNIDETTYMFSPKVLDRANVIEFRVSSSEMEQYLTNPKVLDMDVLKAQGASMGSSFLDGAKSPVIISSSLSSKLLPFFNELQLIGSEFGYRTASEIGRFITICSEMSKEKMNEDKVIDAAIMQKLLPKLHGSRNKIEKTLVILEQLCIVESSSDKATNIKYPLSYEKLERMHTRVLSDGFTSFAEA